MPNALPPINEYTAASRSLLAATRRADGAVSPFNNWLLIGSGAALSLVVANIETVSKFIAVTHIRFALTLFLISVAVAVLATYFGSIVNGGLAAQEDGEALSREIFTNTENFDTALYMAEYERGLLPPIRWLASAWMQKALRGDVVANARFIAKLSQIQSWLVVGQCFLTILAIGAFAFGMKMQ